MSESDLVEYEDDGLWPKRSDDPELRAMLANAVPYAGHVAALKAKPWPAEVKGETISLAEANARMRKKFGLK